MTQSGMVERSAPNPSTTRLCRAVPLPAALRQGGAYGRHPPARPLGQMAFPRLRPPHRARAQLDRQPVDQPRQLACPRRLLDQALLPRAQILGPAGGQGKGVEPKFRVERRSLVGEQPLQVSRFAAGDRGGD